MSSVTKLLYIDKAYRDGFAGNPLDNPSEIGCFSVDANRQIHYNRSRMKYYVPRTGRNLSLDLNVGYEDGAHDHIHSGQSLANLLKWIEYTDFAELNRHEIDFVISRGTLQKLLYTPYSQRSSKPWIICACRLDDVIYIRNIRTDEKIQEEMDRTDRDKRMGSWGHKFEQYITADKPGGVPDISSNTHELEQFCLVVVNRMGPYKLLIRAETDGVDTRGASRLGSGETSCYVEMKTSKAVPNFRTSYQFKTFKSLTWWAQSVIIGIEKNICGLRDEDGIVRAIEEFNTCDLPHLCKGNWKPEVCFNFCKNFLDYLQKTLKENDHRIVYKFEYSGGSRVSATRLQDPEERYCVLPDSYVASYRRERKANRKW